MASTHMAFVLRFIGWFLLTAATTSVLLTALAVLWRRFRRCVALPEAGPPATILKPLCGHEPRLYENLRSFFLQDYASYQLVFGVRDAADPALTVVRRLQQEFPDQDVAIVVDPRVHGINLKVSNLINIMAVARHDLLVLADSDIEVAPSYLRRVVAPLAQPDVGIVTCLYRGRALGGMWSRLGTQFIDEWFLPSVYLAHAFGSTRYAFGATIALRRDALATIGGFEALANIVADDYWLGELTRQQGLRTVLSECEVRTDVTEHRLADLAARELRWMRTIRSVTPLSYAFTFVCFTVPIVALGLALTGLNEPTLCLAAAALAGRLVLHFAGRLQSAPPRTLLASLKHFALFPVRDALSLLLWACAFGGTKVHWRGQQMKIDPQSATRSPA